MTADANRQYIRTVIEPATVLRDQLQFEPEELAHCAVAEPHFIAKDQIPERLKNLNNNSFLSEFMGWGDDSDFIVELNWRTVFR